MIKLEELNKKIQEGEINLNEPYDYIKMCEIFKCEQLKSSNTNGRKSQLKYWETLCKITRPKRGKYSIVEIYEQKKKKVDKRGGNNKIQKYLPLAEPLLLSMLNPDGSNSFHGEFADSVIFSYWFDFKQLTQNDIKKLREEKYKKRISSKFIKKCYEELNLYNFQRRVLVDNSFSKLDDTWDIQRTVKFKTGEREEIGHKVDRNELWGLEKKKSFELYKMDYIYLDLHRKTEVKKEVIKEYNKIHGTQYTNYEKINVVDKYFDNIDEYFDAIDNRENSKAREENIQALKLGFREFAINQLSKSKVEKKKDEEKLIKLCNPKYGERKNFCESDYEIVVKIDLLNFIISKTFKEPQYPSREPFISTYDYLLKRIELLEIIVEEQAEIIDKQAATIDKQAKEIEQLKTELKQSKKGR